MEDEPRKRERERREGDVSLPRLKAGYGNKGRQEEKEKLAKCPADVYTFRMYICIIIGVQKERHGCTRAKQNPVQ